MYDKSKEQKHKTKMTKRKLIKSKLKTKTKDIVEFFLIVLNKIK